MSLNGDRNVLALTRLADQPILPPAHGMRFAARYERLFAGQRAGSGRRALHLGPRTGQISASIAEHQQPAVAAAGRGPSAGW